ncbi:DUF397 domain-containing protein [Micromonospora sp. NPDC023956]|uniref:DUF397 domain-containing protein n=1 Tax=Micromonospora sp. NPDC023956 TaxID=3155722 RepID=UPI003408ABE0
MTPTTHPALATARWRKSSHSGDEGACVEMAVVTDAVATRDSAGTVAIRDSTSTVAIRDSTGTVAIRDSKDPTGPVLLFPPAAWASFADAPPARPTA